MLLGFSGCGKPSDQEIFNAGAVEPESEEEIALYPAMRNPKFDYGREETHRRAAAEFTNFYEFTSKKDVWRVHAGLSSRRGLDHSH